MYKRSIYQQVSDRVSGDRQFIEVLLGPRQVGKTTLALQIAKVLEMPSHYASSDEAALKDAVWLEQQWEKGRLLAKSSEQGAVLILDEIQKISNWSAFIKRYWDEDTKEGTLLKVILLGSSPWLVQKGLTESLAGRFEIIPITHWNFAEMQAAFDFSLEQFIFFGGYPGAANLINDLQRWCNYINDSLVETTVSRDILLMTQINKPILLRRLFNLACHYSGQICSYQKMVGQLQDVGNTTTLASYLELLSGVGLVGGLEKYSPKVLRQRSSSPKLQVYNTALMSAQVGKDLESARQDMPYWGRLVESAVGAYLLNAVRGTNIKLHYWREGHSEVDFVLSNNEAAVGIEVKSGRSREVLRGMKIFKERYPDARLLLVGDGGISLEEFLLADIESWF